MVKVFLLSIIIININLNFPNYIIMSYSHNSSRNSSPVSDDDGWVKSTKKQRKRTAEIPPSIAGYVVSHLKGMRSAMNEVFGRGTYKFIWRPEDCLLNLYGSRNQLEHMVHLLTECFREFNSRRRHRVEEFFIWDDIPKMTTPEITEEEKPTSNNRFNILATLKSQEEIDEEKAKEDRRRRAEAQKVYNSWKNNISFNWADC